MFLASKASSVPVVDAVARQPDADAADIDTTQTLRDKGML